LADKDLFRKDVTVDEIEDFKSELNSNLDKYYYLRIVKYTNAVIGETIIDFFDNLPHGLVYGDYYNLLMKSVEIKDADDRSHAMTTEVIKLPKLNYLVLRKLCETLYCLANYGKVNGLTSKLLAKKFSNVLFRAPKKDQEGQGPHVEAQVLLHLIRYYPDVFLPSENERTQWRDLGSVKYEPWPLPLFEETHDVVFTTKDFPQ
jgi:hypothetical protein